MPYKKRSIIELFCIAALCNENRYLSLPAYKEEMIYEPLGQFGSPGAPLNLHFEPISDVSVIFINEEHTPKGIRYLPYL
jgi:hypothetical protein